MSSKCGPEKLNNQQNPEMELEDLKIKKLLKYHKSIIIPPAIKLPPRHQDFI